jgi:hypothetical protein
MTTTGKTAVSVVLFAGLALAGCGHPRQLQYDYGRAYEQALATQADLDRPTAADAAYELTGIEGIELRKRATETTTDAESGDPEAVKTITN